MQSDRFAREIVAFLKLGSSALAAADAQLVSHLTKNLSIDCLLCLRLPFTQAERDFKHKHGLEALEVKFDEAEIHYWEANRSSVV